MDYKISNKNFILKKKYLFVNKIMKKIFYKRYF